ncbi:MAG: polysaccharide biosynthesis C-terminal domain-containing protein [Rhodothermales bacterium]|nr:polysaccharide biosynthesis C-terminal domain-containing protein [Rhodothermales bacterium]MBO6779386.1 polysaccharide biosynthesis C-terminal domain-containing protein [Rhodothermales bacterium]
MSRIRKLASETAVYGISSVLGRAVNFLLFPFHTQVFAPEILAPIGLVYTAFVFLNILYQYGMESAYLKFASVAEDRRPVFSSSMWSLLISATLFSTALWFFQDAAGPVIGLGPDMTHLLGFAAAILVLDTAAVVPYAELRLSNRAGYFAFVRVTSALVNVAGNVILILGAGLGIEAVLIANVASSATGLLLLTGVVRRNLQLAFDRSLWRKLLRFGLPFLPGGLGYAVSERVNIFFLENMPAERVLDLYASDMPAETLAAVQAGQAEAASFVVGVYTGMIKLGVLAALGVQMFRYAWQPFFLNHARDEDAPDLFARVFLLLTAGLFAVVLGVSLFAQELVAIPIPGGGTLIDSAFWLGLIIVPPALIGYAFQGWYYHFAAGAYIEKRTGLFVRCTLIGSVVALAVNTWAVPQFGMLGAVWATTSAYATMAMALWLYLRPHYPVPYPWARALTLVAGCLAALVIWNRNPGLQVWWAELGLLGAYGLLALVTLRPLTRRVTETS